MGGLKNEFVVLCFQGRPIFSRLFQIFTKPTPAYCTKKFHFSPSFLCKTENREKIKKFFEKGVDNSAVVWYNRGTKGKSATGYAMTADRQERPQTDCAMTSKKFEKRFTPCKN